MTAHEILEMQAEDEELGPIMKGHFHDLTKGDVPVQKKPINKMEPALEEAKAEDAEFEPVSMNWFDYLKISCKSTAVFACISLGCFWGIQTGNMSGAMGWPIIYACTAVCAFMLGKYFKEAMK